MPDTDRLDAIHEHAERLTDRAGRRVSHRHCPSADPGEHGIHRRELLRPSLTTETGELDVCRLKLRRQVSPDDVVGRPVKLAVEKLDRCG